MDYWLRRSEILEESRNRKAALVRRDAEREFTTAQRTLDDQIRAWYGRFAENNQISLVDAHKWLNDKELAEFKWDVNEYIRRGRENATNLQWTKELENASARYHISRLEALKIQTRNTMERLYGSQLDAVDGLMKRTYLDGYYHSAYELQRGTGVGFDIAGIDERRLDKVIHRPWTADGDTFSDRIWTQKKELIDEVHKQLTQNMILGRSPEEAINAISKKFNTSKANASRLIMTESAFIATMADKDAYREMGVEEFEIVGTLDRKTCRQCGGMDGKTGRVSRMTAGITAPPFHPWCRCTTAPYFDDEDGERFARDGDGKAEYVPHDMNYKQWKEKYVDGGEKAGLTETGSSAKIRIGGEKMGAIDANKIIPLDDIQIGRSVGSKAKNFSISNPDGGYFTLVEGSRITDIEIIAGKGCARKIDIVDYLVEYYGGVEEEWQKVKGIGLVDVNGEPFKAELHWFQEDNVGKVMWKLKPQKGGNWYID